MSQAMIDLLKQHVKTDGGDVYTSIFPGQSITISYGDQSIELSDKVVRFDGEDFLTVQHYGAQRENIVTYIPWWRVNSITVVMVDSEEDPDATF